MASSEYYYAELMRIEKDIETENDRHKQYEILLGAAEGTQSALGTASSLITNADGNLKSGGYPQGGIDLGSANFGSIEGNVATIISNTQNELDKIENKIGILNNDYNTTYSLYLEALQAEQNS